MFLFTLFPNWFDREARCCLEYTAHANSTTLRIRIPLPWGSAENVFTAFQASISVNNKNDETRNFVTLTLRNLADKVDFFFNPNILKNFLLGVGGFVFPNGDQKVLFQPHFRQNTRLFQDPEDPHSTTLMICQPPLIELSIEPSIEVSIEASCPFIPNHDPVLGI